MIKKDKKNKTRHIVRKRFATHNHLCKFDSSVCELCYQISLDVAEREGPAEIAQPPSGCRKRVVCASCSMCGHLDLIPSPFADVPPSHSSPNGPWCQHNVWPMAHCVLVLFLFAFCTYVWIWKIISTCNLNHVIKRFDASREVLPRVLLLSTNPIKRPKLSDHKTKRELVYASVTLSSFTHDCNIK